MRYSVFFLLAPALVATACSGGSSPMNGNPMSPSMVTTSGTPASTATPVAAASLGGNWSGGFTDSGGSAVMAWQAVQAGTQLHGDMDWTDGGQGMHGAGTLAAVIHDDRMDFTASVPAGGFGSMMGGCTLSISGGGQFDPSWDTCTGTYSGTNSCTGIMTNGQFTLHR